MRRVIRWTVSVLLCLVGLAFGAPLAILGLGELDRMVVETAGICRYDDAADARRIALAAYDDLRARRGADRPLAPVEEAAVRVERDGPPGGYLVLLPLADGSATFIGIAGCDGGLEFSVDREPWRRPPGAP